MRAIMAILKRNLINFTRDRMRLFFTIFMSVFFLFIFSFVMKSSTMGVVQPMNYLISGIIIMTVFQAAFTNSTGILDDIASGFMKEILVAPISRWQISIGQILSASIISVLQGCIVIIMGLFMGLNLDLLHFTEMIGVMIVAGITFSSIGLFLATVAKSSTTFQLIMTIATLPLTFLSGAYIPTMSMPDIIKPLVYINPLTYITAIFRFISLKMENLPQIELLKSGVAFDLNSFVIMPYAGLVIVIAIGILFFSMCVAQFNKADFSTVKVFEHGKH